MSLGIWENLNFDLNNFKCVVKGFLKTDKGNFLLYRDEDARLRLKVEGVVSDDLDFNIKSGQINKMESLVIFQHKVLQQKILMYALPIKSTRSLVGDNFKYTDIFAIDEVAFEDNHEEISAEYLIEFVDNLKINHVFPCLMRWNETHEKKFNFLGSEFELTQNLIGKENSTRNMIGFTVENDLAYIVKTGEENKGLIVFRKNLDPIKRDRIRKIISYILGCPLIFYGYTYVDKYMSPSISSLMNICDSERAYFSVNFQLPSPLCLRLKNSIDSNLFNVLFNDLYVKYDEFHLSNVFFTYWIAVNSNSISAAVHYGALIEKLQATYMKIHDVSYSKILDKSVFKKMRERLEEQLEELDLTAEQKRIFLNKIGNMNTYSQKDKMDFFCKDILLSLSDIERIAWQQRNDAAHGNDVSDVNQAWKNTMILRELLNKIILKLLTSNKYYLSYLDCNPKIKEL